MNLKSFEDMLAGVADDAITNVTPTGGFAAYLQKTPAVAVLFSIAIVTAHTYLSGLEAKLAPTPVTTLPTALHAGVSVAAE